MLERLATNEVQGYGSYGITLEEVEALAVHVSEYEKEKAVDPVLLESLYLKLPEHVVYDGFIYRGLQLYYDDFENLLNNKSFQGSDTSENVSAVSWSWDEYTAQRFATGKVAAHVLSDGLGIVLESHTSEKQPIVQCDSEVYKVLYDDIHRALRHSILVDEDREEEESVLREIMRKLAVIEDFSWIKEVGVKNIGEELYTLCDDVSILAVRTDFFASYPDLAEILIPRIEGLGMGNIEYMRNYPYGEDVDPDEIEQWKEDGTLFDMTFQMPWMFLKCDGEGNFTVMEDGPSRDWG